MPRRPPSASPPADTTAPKLTGLTFAKHVTRRKGTRIRFTLTEAATVRLAFGQPKTGRTVGAKCRALTKGNRTKTRCTIAGVKGSLTIAGKAGANTLAFNGRLDASKQLALGRYTLVATPTDGAGNVGTPVSRRFTLAR